jgi:6-phosphofructokinase
MTYNRVFFVGLFGRNTDWVTAAVTAYGGGDLGIPCEKEYDWEDILERIKAAYNKNAANYGRGFAVVPYSEGACIRGVDPPPANHCSLDKHGLPKLQPEWLGLELVRLCKEAKLSAAFQTHTYDMRDYPPTETDKTLSAMAGEKCMEMVLEREFGKAVVFKPIDDFYTVDTAPLTQVAVQRKLSDTDYFDYQNLKTNASFIRDYGNLFRPSLGDPPNKEALVYPCMLGPF